jgi:DNA repair protein RadC
MELSAGAAIRSQPSRCRSDEKNIIMHSGPHPASIYQIPREIAGSSEAKALLAAFLNDREAECLIVIHVDDQLGHLQFTCHRGLASSVVGPTNKIIADAVALGTKGLILAHNHPAGDPNPSESDLRFTQYLAAVCEPVDVTLLDHLIFANGNWTSFRERGLL